MNVLTPSVGGTVTGGASRGRKLRVVWATHVVPGFVRPELDMAPAPAMGSWLNGLFEALAPRQEVDVTLLFVGPRRRAGTLTCAEVTCVCLPEREAGVPVVRTLRRWRGGVGGADQVVHAAQRALAELQPDLVHVHGTESPFVLLTEASTVPVLVSLQGILSAFRQQYFTGWSQLDRARLMLRSDFVKGWGLLHEYRALTWRARLEGRGLSSAGHVTGRTDWDHEFCARAAPGARYYHCDEVLRPPFRQIAWQAADHGGAVDGGAHVRTGARWPRVYSTSSGLPGKGTECLLAAAARLLTRFPRLEVRVAGVPRYSALDGFYRRVACRHGVEHVVTWLGSCSAQTVAEELAAADVFAYPSHVDNSPNALCEAMSVGVPIVASHVGGIPSLLEDGREGRLVPDGDARALADALAEVLDEPARAAEYARVARERARERHDPAVVAASMVSIYREVAGLR